VRPENTAYDGRFEIPTLAEVLRLVQREERRTGRTIGVAPEDAGVDGLFADYTDAAVAARNDWLA
jgi:hypothetical protein